MHVISKETLELIRKADKGCPKSQITVGAYYLGTNELPDDPIMATHYMSQFFEIPYGFVRARKILSAEHYLQALIRCGRSYGDFGEYKMSIEYYDRAIEFAKLHFQEKDCKHLFERHQFTEFKNLMESYVNDGYDSYDVGVTYND